MTEGPTKANRAGDSQGLPTINDEQDIQSRVVEDIRKRRELGISRYGTALQPFNGRDALLDLYEELLDAVMYIKQSLVERDGLLHDEVRAMAQALVVCGYGTITPNTDASDVLVAFRSFLSTHD
jgi:hypothetical protein